MEHGVDDVKARKYLRTDCIIYNGEDVLGTIECNHFVEVVRIDQEIVMEIELGRLEENGALVFGKRHVVIDCVVHVSMVDRYLTMSKTSKHNYSK